LISNPTSTELARAVADWIEDLRPRLEPRDAFLARVAVNALGVLQREMARGPEAQAKAEDRLRALLDQPGTYTELNAKLSDRLRAGTLAWDTPGLFATLRDEVHDRLAIDQPSYAATPSALPAETGAPRR
jgi:hypothetical protein